MINNFEETIKDKYHDITIEYNLHTHTYLCGHAQGSVVDYVKEAIDKKFSLIGMSDHIEPPHYERGYIDIKDIDNLYLPQFIEAEKLYSKDITILKAGEIEYFRGEDNFFQELLKRLDYLVLGEHVYFYNNGNYGAFGDKKDINEAIEFYTLMLEGIKSGYFKVLAHPDFFLCKYTALNKDKVVSLMEECIKEANNRGMLIELNANGIRNGFQYPTDELVNACIKTNAKVVISSDSHIPYQLLDNNMKKLICYSREIGLNIATLDEVKSILKS